MTGNTNSGLSLSAFLETVVINVSNNVGKIISPIITLSYSGLTKEFTKFPVIEKIPEGTDYTISFSNINHYLTPSTITGKAISGLTRNYNGEYKACLLTVNSNLSCSITITSPSFTAVMNNGDTLQLVWGETATISFSDIDGYITPENITVTANQSAISIEGIYEEVSVEVKIMDLEGNLHNINSWTGGNNATGVVLISDNVSLVIAPDEWCSTTDGEWEGCSSSSMHNLDSGDLFINNYIITAIQDPEEMVNDFDGLKNNINCLNYLGTDQTIYSPAMSYCKNYSKGYKGTLEWYLPSAGELNEIIQNKDLINKALNKISGKLLGTNTELWTSTVGYHSSPTLGFWYYSFQDEGILQNFNLDTSANSSFGVRPVSSYNSNLFIFDACGYMSMAENGMTWGDWMESSYSPREIDPTTITGSTSPDEINYLPPRETDKTSVEIYSFYWSNSKYLLHGYNYYDLSTHTHDGYGRAAVYFYIYTDGYSYMNNFYIYKDTAIVPYATYMGYNYER